MIHSYLPNTTLYFMIATSLSFDKHVRKIILGVGVGKVKNDLSGQPN